MTTKYPMLMTPVSKEIIWGGDLLKKNYGKVAPFEKIAESWELTVRENEMCTISNGSLAGKTMAEYIESDREGILGTNCMKYDRFPLLIKFIDAADRLSIQVHPADEYSLKNEGELGKTEMWYIMDAQPGAKLVYGLKDGVTEADFADAVRSGRTEDALNFVDVHPGEVYFIPAGQVHAIGAGILIAEIQQNSNITYRVYDYNRKDANGNPRQLHTEKAIDVTKVRTTEEIDAIRYTQSKDLPVKLINSVNAYESQCLAACDYFSVWRMKFGSGSVIIDKTPDSFLSVLVLEADSAKIGEFDAKKGDSFFIPADCETEISGSVDVIISKVN